MECNLYSTNVSIDDFGSVALMIFTKEFDINFVFITRFSCMIPIMTFMVDQIQIDWFMQEITKVSHVDFSTIGFIHCFDQSILYFFFSNSENSFLESYMLEGGH